GAALVAAFMITFYATGGLVAVGTLAVNLAIILGVMATLGAALTLPGLAGIVLTIGMAVDANILIFERMREELAQGCTPAAANRAGYRKALTTIVDAHLVQLIICGIMIWLGHGPIRGFGVTLLIGVLSTLFSVLITAHMVMEILLESGRLKKLTFRRLVKDLRVDFVKYGKPAFIASWLVVLMGVAVILHRGERIYGTDFTGGDVVNLQFTRQAPAEAEIRSVAAASGLKEINVTTVRPAGSARESMNIEVPEGKGSAVSDALRRAFPESGFEQLGQDHVGAAVGRETQFNALLAVGVSMLVILVYIAFRFELGYGIGAVVATLHDLLMTIGIFVLTGRQFNAPMVAALLCIAGYSINETVVVFDRIREELKLNPSGSLREVVNDALRKVFARTIMTASTTFLAALALYLFGGGVLQDISFTFLVGIVSATFSAIFVAAQVFYWWHRGDRGRVEGEPIDPEQRRPWLRAAAPAKAGVKVAERWNALSNT
ncbi:MAG TPA: protein translocase subunit SecF, partial [Opitutaceae bacterium]|nr:protein translocase subunit SecF [Opitutaceae bacterium]